MTDCARRSLGEGWSKDKALNYSKKIPSTFNKLKG
jgi:hypothetical protein